MNFLLTYVHLFAKRSPRSHVAVKKRQFRSKSSSRVSAKEARDDKSIYRYRNSGRSCFPSWAAFRASGTLSKSATREWGLETVSSWHKGVK